MLQSTTGVKDKIASFWVEKCIAKARELQTEQLTNVATRDPRLNQKTLKGDARKAVKDEITRAIQTQVFAWLLKQPRDRYDALDADSPLRSQLRPGDHFNVALVLPGIDPHLDTPVEILHTYLLGQDKYVWYATHSNWDEKKSDTFTVRLQSSSTDGLSLDRLRAQYMVQYKNALVGRHFKALQQLGIFHLHGGLCSDMMFDLWRATGELGALLWYHKITNMETYLADLKVLINNVLDIWALIDPNRIICKPKLHALPHILEDIRRFGPALLFATEIFECFNSVFRLCSILSNRQSPSRDIATTFAGMERFKHQVSGGYWQAEDGTYIQAGREIRKFLKDNTQLQRRLGWVSRSVMTPGIVELIPRQGKSTGHSWSSIASECSAQDLPEPAFSSTGWRIGKYCVSQSRDECHEGSWVFYRSKEQQGESTTCGRIRKILVPLPCEGGELLWRKAIVLIERFSTSNTPHSRLNMPLLTRASQGPRLAIVTTSDVLFIFNAQHNCSRSGCSATGQVNVRQERSTTEILEKAIVHLDDNHFILNMHALHNAALTREALPRSLTEPRPYIRDRQAKLDEIAQGLRISGPVKRAQAAAKAAETRARNKKMKEARNTNKAPDVAVMDNAPADPTVAPGPATGLSAIL